MRREKNLFTKGINLLFIKEVAYEISVGVTQTWAEIYTQSRQIRQNKHKIIIAELPYVIVNWYNKEWTTI